MITTLNTNGTNQEGLGPLSSLFLEIQKLP